MKISGVYTTITTIALAIETPIFLGLLAHYKSVKEQNDYYNHYIDEADWFFDNAIKLVDDTGIEAGLVQTTAEQFKLASQSQTVTSVEDYTTSSQVKKEKSKITGEEWAALALQGLSSIASGLSKATTGFNANVVATAK